MTEVFANGTVEYAKDSLLVYLTNKQVRDLTDAVRSFCDNASRQGWTLIGTVQPKSEGDQVSSVRIVIKMSWIGSRQGVSTSTLRRQFLARKQSFEIFLKLRFNITVFPRRERIALPTIQGRVMRRLAS